MTSQTFLTAHLPDEIYQTVFEFCFGNASTLASLELVSKKFNSILKEDIWKRAWFHAYPTTIGKISGDLRFALLQMEEYKKKDLDIAKKLNRDIVVVLTGTHRSGKSSIAERLVNNTFTQNYNISFNYSNEEAYRFETNINGEKRMVDLFDSTATEKYSAMLDYYIRRSHCILIVFSVTDRCGLEDALVYVDSAERCVETKATTLLVANQIDSANRYLSTQQISDAARRHGVPFVETSALTGENIQAMLDQAIMIARFGMFDMDKICEMLSQGRSLKELINPLKNAKKKRCVAS